MIRFPGRLVLALLGGLAAFSATTIELPGSAVAWTPSRDRCLEGALTLSPRAGDALVTSSGRFGFGLDSPSRETELHVRTDSVDDFDLPPALEALLDRPLERIEVPARLGAVRSRLVAST